MAIGVRLDPELEQRLDRLAGQLGKSRSACVRESIAASVLRDGDADEALLQSQLVAASEQARHWSEQVPDWSDWTA
jgi:predicted transcriptional regulator